MKTSNENVGFSNLVGICCVSVNLCECNKTRLAKTFIFMFVCLWSIDIMLNEHTGSCTNGNTIVAIVFNWLTLGQMVSGFFP